MNKLSFFLALIFSLTSSAFLTPTGGGGGGTVAPYSTLSTVFQAVYSYITGPTSFGPDYNTAHTFAGWAYISPNQIRPYEGFMVKFDGTSGFGHQWQSNGSVLVHYLNGSGSLNLTTAAGTFPAGKWTHYAATLDGTGTAAGTHIYINGVDTAFTTNVNTLSSSITNSDPLYLGFEANAGSDNSYMNGEMNNWAYYTAALTAPQVLAVYNAQANGTALSALPGSSASLANWWKLGAGDNATTSHGFLDSAGSAPLTGTGMSKASIVSDYPSAANSYFSLFPSSMPGIQTNSVLLSPTAAITSYTAYNYGWASLLAGVNLGTDILDWGVFNSYPFVQSNVSIFPGGSTQDLGSAASTAVGRNAWRTGRFDTSVVTPLISTNSGNLTLAPGAEAGGTGTVLFPGGLIGLTPFGNGVTPTCGAPQSGALAETSAWVLCVCNGSAWKSVAVLASTCTF